MIEAGGAAWEWRVDPGVEPRRDALEVLVDVIESWDGELPALLASKVVDAGGRLDPGSLPVLDTRDPDALAQAFERRLLPIRAARAGALLVRSGAPVSGRDLVWTARLLRYAPGVLVPASVAVRAEALAREPLDLRARLSLLAGDALAPGEKPWFAFRLLEDVLVRPRGG